eukprot:g27656.t1
MLPQSGLFHVFLLSSVLVAQVAQLTFVQVLSGNDACAPSSLLCFATAARQATRKAKRGHRGSICILQTATFKHKDKQLLIPAKHNDAQTRYRVKTRYISCADTTCADTISCADTIRA